MDKISTPNKGYYFNIGVNPNLEDADAMVSPCYKLNLDTMKPKPGFIGQIYFKDKSCFTSGVIAHEALHCATAYLRIFEPEKVQLNVEDCDKNEERLAWLTGWFAKEITNYYYDKVAG